MVAFVAVGLAAIGAAIGVVTARRVMHSVLWLIVHLCSLAVLYFTLDATFLGLVQILLYAGAVIVLFLFVIGLLTARTGPEPLPSQQPRGQVPLALLAGGVVALLLLAGAATGAAGPGRALPLGWGAAASFGGALFGPYLLPFEATALVLLVALVGVVALTHGHDVEVVGEAPVPEASAPDGLRTAPTPPEHPQAAVIGPGYRREGEVQ